MNLDVFSIEIELLTSKDLDSGSVVASVKRYLLVFVASRRKTVGKRGPNTLLYHEWWRSLYFHSCSSSILFTAISRWHFLAQKILGTHFFRHRHESCACDLIFHSCQTVTYSLLTWLRMHDACMQRQLYERMMMSKYTRHAPPICWAPWSCSCCSSIRSREHAHARGFDGHDSSERGGEA